jgi:hypothetical protein
MPAELAPRVFSFGAMTDFSSTSDPASADAELFCPSCGYDLRNIASDRCPECGESIDRKTVAVSLIPWVHRREIGRVRAFLRTVWLAIRRPDAIARECARPVSYRDAQLFRWTVVFIAWLPMAILAAAWWYTWARPEKLYRQGTPWYAEPLIRVLGPGSFGGWVYRMLIAPGSLSLNLLVILLWLVTSTGVASYFFHPKALASARQDRAVALSYYGSAPLALLPLLELSFFALIAFAATTGWDFATLYAFSDNFRALWLGAIAAAVAIALTWWVNTLRILRGTTHAGPAKLLTVGLVLPVLWLSLSPLIFVLLHGIVSYALLIALHW